MLEAPHHLGDVAMKNVEIDPAIQADPSLLSSVRRGNELLEVELGRSAGLVSAAWSLLRDGRDHPLVRLEISDWTGHAGAVFTPEDLKNADLLQGRMIRLWGDLLQIRSHQLLSDLQATTMPESS
jgi:hypothetical protein